jgi:hypothetical protein
MSEKAAWGNVYIEKAMDNVNGQCGTDYCDSGK